MEIINSYNKLSIGSYLEICDVCDDKSLSEDDKQVEIISILSGKSVDELMKMPITDFKRLSMQTKFLEDEFPARKSRIPKEFHLGDMVFAVTTDVTKMTTAQYVDFQTFSEMGKEKLVEILSCFFIPKGMEYNEGYDIIEVQRILRDNLSVTEAVNMSAFFLNRCIDWMKITLIYSRLMLRRVTRKKDKTRTETMEQISRLWTDLTRSGDGWTMSLLWWRLPVRHGMMYGR